MSVCLPARNEETTIGAIVREVRSELVDDTGDGLVDEPLHGLGGDRRIDRLRIFRRLEFLAPQRRIRIFFDRSALFFARGDATAFTATLAWRTDAGERCTRTIRHDLDVYRDFPYLEVPRDA